MGHKKHRYRMTRRGRVQFSIGSFSLGLGLLGGGWLLWPSSAPAMKPLASPKITSTTPVCESKIRSSGQIRFVMDAHCALPYGKLRTTADIDLEGIGTLLCKGVVMQAGGPDQYTRHDVVILTMLAKRDICP